MLCQMAAASLFFPTRKHRLPISGDGSPEHQTGKERLITRERMDIFGIPADGKTVIFQEKDNWKVTAMLFILLVVWTEQGIIAAMYLMGKHQE